ncbi:uncharacterized protein LOC141639360 isoform X2 [Silene latifolia]
MENVKRGEKRGVNRDRSVSSSASTLPPPKARKIKDRPRIQEHFELHRNYPVFPTESTMLGLKSESSFGIGVKRHRSVSSSASSSTLPPPKARKIKDQPRVREPHVQEHSGSSELHRKVFKKCGHKRPVFSTESTMLSLKSKSCEMCSTGRSKRSESWDSEMILGSSESIESSATQVLALLDQKKITSEAAMRAMEKFDDSYCLRILWLKMSLEHQIKYVKSLIQKNKIKSMSKAPSRYS